MEKPRLGLLILALVFVSACAPRQTIVLVPDPDGHVGRAEVSTAGGAQLLEKAGDMTRVSGPSAPPSAVSTADPRYIATTFADALAVEPMPPDRFILYFESGATALTAQSQATLAEVLQAIRRRGARWISVSGHTDATGSAQINDRLALERANHVRDLLVEGGVQTEQISVTSHGKGNPLIATPDGVVEPRNRRVEVVVR